MNRIKVLLLPSTCTPVAGTDTFHLSSCQRLHVALRVCCGAAQPSGEGLKQREGAGAAGLGKVTCTQTGSDPAPGSHLPPAQSACKLDHVFTRFCDVQEMHRCTWCVHRQTHPSYLKVKETHSYTCAGLGFCGNAALVHHYGSPVENGLEKMINSLGCSLLLLGAVKLLALVYQLQGKKYLCVFFSVVRRIWFEQTLGYRNSNYLMCLLGQSCTDKA